MPICTYIVVEMATHSVILTHGRTVILNIPRNSAREAAQACEVLKNCVVEGSDIEITITNDLELVDRLLEFTEKANRNPLVI